jgi:putative glutamine amidotransferase
MKPRIGITSRPSPYHGRPAESLERAYTDAVAATGALPFVLPVLSPARSGEVLAELDGLLLTGGGDVASSWYGEEPAPEAYDVDLSRDEWELALVAGARATGVPVLGICRGAQVVNVAAGGSLVQHLPAYTDQEHRDDERDRTFVHEVEVAPASLLAGITGSGEFGVNSLHHQAVARVGRGLRPVAWAPDGVIEAIESTHDDLLLAVQWHPELLADHLPHALLFAWLVEAARTGRQS